jgi:hypothetical protein
MFSALKFVVASVIVALFGGLLLAGILGTQLDDEVVPAAGSASPGPDRTAAPTGPLVRSDIVPGVELTVEAVEPGVYRIIDDGVRDMAAVDSIAFGLDGGLWSETDEGVFRLGGELVAWPSGTKRSPEDDWRLRGVTPEGVIWTSEWEPPGFGQDVDVIRSFDGEQWTVRKQDRPDVDLHFGPDGTVYGGWWDPPGIEGLPVSARYGADGWEPLDEPFADGIGDWFADDGDTWVQHDGGLSAYRDGELRSTYTQPAWTESRDGIWVRTAPRRLDSDGRASAPDAGTWPLDDYSVMTFARDGWRALGPDDILRSLDGVEVDVSPEGDLWTWRPGWPDEGSGCDSRPSRYDGERWARYLPDRCVEDIEFASDGSAWVLTGVGASGLEQGDPFERHELYVITPGAPGTHDGVEPADETDRAQTLDILPGVALNVEEVEPGIYHLLDDGVWDLSPSFHVGTNGVGPSLRDSIVAGDDGGVYVLLENGFFRLGDDVIHPWPVASEEPFRRDIEVAEDGSVWVMTGDFDTPGRLHSFDGDSWVSGLDPDTGEWALRYSADAGSSWQILETPYSAGDPGMGYDPLAIAGRLAVVDDGDLWVGSQQTSPWHYRDGAWHEPESGATGGFHSRPQANRDGVLWSVRPDTGTLRRFDGSDWQAWRLDELDLRPGGWWGSADRYLVAPDGSLWAHDVGSPTNDGAAHAAPCPPLARFDGVTVQRFLPETCGGPVSLDVAADGSVWVASEHDLYVITPEALGATE